MQNKRIPQLIDRALGARVRQAKYSNSDISMYWIYANLCGAERLENTMVLKEFLDSIPNFAIPSSDTISGMFRKLATGKTIEMNSDVEHELCINERMNGLMLDIAKRLGTPFGDVLDYDNVIIETEKYDTRWTYEKKKGYQPGVAFIGETPVYIEGRNGNSGAIYKMPVTLENCMRLLDEKKIKVKYFRSDSAAFQKEVVDMMDSRGIQFFIRTRSSKVYDEAVGCIRNWERFLDSNGRLVEYGSTDYIPFYTMYNMKDKPVKRLVVKRDTSEDGTVRISGIVTNNWKMSAKEVVDFYNGRGAIERNFDDLKNNFNWGRLPFSFMNENLVFMIISAIAKIIYAHVRKTFSDKLDFVKNTYRLQNFIKHFIKVHSFWTKKGYLRLFTEKNYHPIFY